MATAAGQGRPWTALPWAVRHVLPTRLIADGWPELWLTCTPLADRPWVDGRPSGRWAEETWALHLAGRPVQLVCRSGHLI